VTDSPYELPAQYGDSPAPPPSGPAGPYEELEAEQPAVVLRGPDDEEPGPEATSEHHHDEFWSTSADDRAATAATAAAAAATSAAPATPAAPAAPAAPTTAPDGRPLTRREIREQQERERGQVKTKNGPPRSPRSKRRRWITIGILAVLLVVLIIPAISYVDYMRKPSSDSMSVRTVEWIRDNGGNGVVNTIERWWYTNNPPPTGGTPGKIQVQNTVAGSQPKTTQVTLPQFQTLAPPTARVATPAPDVQPNEGVWQPTGRLVAGHPAVYTTYVRPDATHTSYYTALMWLDTKLLKANYVVGTEQPGGNGPNPWGSKIPPDVQPNAVAAFNSGFKMDSANGGAYLDGVTMVPLRDGSASLVIDQNGVANVGVWGRDFTMTPDIKAVRQNLVLMVDNGQLNPSLRENDTTDFGATLGNNVYVWRSGVGVTADGALIYAGGPSLSVLALARTLQAAGAVRAMELDINTDWVSAFTFVPSDPANPSSPTMGVKLLPAMTHGPDQYLQPNQPNSRDFFAFTGDPKAIVPTTTTKPGATTTTKPGSTTTTTRKP
jgi:hypothetical protein